LDSASKTIAKSSTVYHAKFSSVPFGVGSLLDLLKGRITVADPFACFANFSRIHRNGAWNFLSSRN
jgi:hypothetical protein